MPLKFNPAAITSLTKMYTILPRELQFFCKQGESFRRFFDIWPYLTWAKIIQEKTFHQNVVRTL